MDGIRRKRSCLRGVGEFIGGDVGDKIVDFSCAQAV